MVILMVKTCDYPGCGRASDEWKIVRGYCTRHYQRMKSSGRLRVEKPRYMSPGEALEGRTERRGDCLIWTGTKNQKGYGRLRVGWNLESAHRVAFELAHGPIPDGAEVDHVCFNRACVEPAHLRLADRSTNSQYRRGAQPNSKSGIRNVHEKNGKWYVRLKVKQKNRIWGPFETVDEASTEAKRRREEFFYRPPE